MRQAFCMVLVLVVSISMVGCSGLSNNLEHRQLTVEEQIEVAKLGLEFAREAYMAYLEYRDSNETEDTEQGQELMDRIYYYAERLQELRDLADEMQDNNDENSTEVLEDSD